MIPTLNFYNESVPKHQFSKRTFTKWKVFKQQILAIQEKGPNDRIFSFQYDLKEPGKRKYLVTDLKTFYDEYQAMSERHYYELVEEGLPCHLYFDIEFEICLNPDKDGNTMMSIFKSFVIKQMNIEFNLTDEFELIELDSTTEHKFSRHLILRHPSHKFKNNAQAGLFVKKLIDILHDSMVNPNQFSAIAKILMVTGKNKISPFVDESVYSRNRNFRIWLSSKLGKDSILDFIPKREMSLDLFMKTLVVDDTPSKYFEAPYLEITAMPSRNNQPNLFPSRIVNEYVDNPVGRKLISLIYYISGKNAYIRSSVYSADNKTIVFHIGGNRYCHRISREHNSNHVYYIVDPFAFTCFQKCLDPDCRGFQSQTYDLEEYNRECADLTEGIKDAHFIKEVEAFESTILDDEFYFKEMDDNELLLIEL